MNLAHFSPFLETAVSRSIYYRNLFNIIEIEFDITINIRIKNNAIIKIQNFLSLDSFVLSVENKTDNDTLNNMSINPKATIK